MRWLNHSRMTRRSPNTRSNTGLKDSISMRVSLTSKTNTRGRPGKGAAGAVEGDCHELSLKWLLGVYVSKEWAARTPANDGAEI